MGARHAQSSFAPLLGLIRAIALLGFAFPTSIIDATMTASAAAPSKKATRKSQPVAPARASPDITATTPKNATPKALAPPPSIDQGEDDKVVPPAFNLPTASRARMRACGEGWQALKMAGKAGDQTWRSYATKCLVSKDASADDKPKSARP